MSNFGYETKAAPAAAVLEAHDDATSTSDNVDDALRFLKARGADGSGGASVCDVDERKFLRKIDWFIMPILFSVYFLQYTDKSLRGDAPNSPSNCRSLVYVVHGLTRGMVRIL